MKSLKITVFGPLTAEQQKYDDEKHPDTYVLDFIQGEDALERFCYKVRGESAYDALKKWIEGARGEFQ